MARSLFSLLSILVLLAPLVLAADPDPVADFVDPADRTAATFFPTPAVPAGAGGVTQRFSAANFPALRATGLSNALVTFKACSQLAPHYHPRASEILFVVSGRVTVFLVDTTYVSRVNTLQAGDVAIFPRGLVHAVINYDPHNGAVTYSALNSQNAGTVFLTEALFKGFPLNVLRDTFRTSGLQLSLINATLPTGVIEGNIFTCKQEFANYQPTFPHA